jgi:hypothetical protein
MKRLLLLTALTAACGPKAPTVRAVIDTLPGGIVRVQNPAPSGWADTAHITFTEIARIQPADGEAGELGDIWGMVVDDEGGVWVSQPGPTRIGRFAPDGSYRGEVGRQGSGPGEYQGAMLIWAGGHLFVQDPTNQRTSVFDTAGKFVSSWHSSCCIWRDVGGDTLGRAYIPVMPSDGGMDQVGQGWIRYAVDGTVVDTLWSPASNLTTKYWEFSPGPGSHSRYGIPYQPGIVDAPYAGGGLLVGQNDSYTIRISRTGKDTALVFGREWTPEPIPESVRRTRFDEMTEKNEPLKAVAKFEDIPLTAPAYRGFDSDAEGRIWVQLSVPRDTVGTYWDLFTPQGVWLGTVHAPFKYDQIAFRPGEIVVSMTDDADLPVIVRYRMVEVGTGDVPKTSKLGS